jgi:hypothetical protein
MATKFRIRKGKKMFKYAKNDVQVYFSQVVQLVGQRIGIEDASWKSSAEVLELIKKTDKSLLDKLKLFFEAYEAWWEYDKKLEDAVEIGRLTETEFKERERLVSQRDSTRKSFIEMLP